MAEPNRPSLWVTERGLWLGHHRILSNAFTCFEATKAARVDRLSLNLAIAFRRRLSPELVQTVVEAADIALRGEVALANIRLAFAGLPPASGTADLPDRLAMADWLLAHGMTANELMAALDDGAGTDGLGKFDPDQPRVPPGSGPTSGRWSSDAAGATATAGAAAATAAAVGAAVALEETSPLFTAGLGATTLSALTALAASVGFASVFGVLFVPAPNAGSTSGPLPDDPEAGYAYDADTGLLRVVTDGTIALAGHADRSGIFHDAATARAFARRIAGSLVFDATAIEDARDDTDADVVPRLGVDERADEDEPKLCPEPGPDHPSGKPSPRAKAYQEQISAMINPQRPLPYGLAMNLINPLSDKLVHFDECDESDGTMIDAKGPGLAGLLRFEPGRNSLTNDWLGQGARQVQASGSRRLEWYFAEPEAAAYAIELFSKNGLSKIEVRVQKANQP